METLYLLWGPTSRSLDSDKFYCGQPLDFSSSNVKYLSYFVFDITEPNTCFGSNLKFNYNAIRNITLGLGYKKAVK